MAIVPDPLIKSYEDAQDARIARLLEKYQQKFKAQVVALGTGEDAGKVQIVRPADPPDLVRPFIDIIGTATVGQYVWCIADAGTTVAFGTASGGGGGGSIPTGGTTGQVLAKTSNANYATGWTTLVGATPNPAYVALQLSADQSLSSGNTVIAFDTAVTDTQSLFTASQNGVTIARTGRYIAQLSVSCRSITASRRIFCQLRVNGAATGRLTDDDVYPSFPGPSGMLPVYLNAGQIITASMFTDGAVTVAASTSTQLILMEL